MARLLRWLRLTLLAGLVLVVLGVATLGVAYWLIVPSGGTASVVLSYEGPFADISRSPLTYSLSWERQNSALTWPIDVLVTLPRVTPVRLSTDLSVDRSWSLIGGRA